jgi:hypothetical protein
MVVRILFVMAGFIPAIHVLCAFKTWMAGTGPAMTNLSHGAKPRNDVRNEIEHPAPR